MQTLSSFVYCTCMPTQILPSGTIQNLCKQVTPFGRASPHIPRRVCVYIKSLSPQLQGLDTPGEMESPAGTLKIVHFGVV